jgi:serine/threonine-protein kinase
MESYVSVNINKNLDESRTGNFQPNYINPDIFYSDNNKSFSDNDIPFYESNAVDTIRSSIERVMPPSYSEYELIKIIGKGYFGTVWEARTKDGKSVALKIIRVNPDDTKMLSDLYKEVEILTKISNPECQPFLVCFNGYNYNQDTNEFVIEMDMIKGKDLTQYAKSVFPISRKCRHLLLIMKDLVEVLKYLHQNGILHNDVKPDNILIDKDLTPKLVDFGVACMNLSLCPIDKTESLCCRGVFGPILYASPEIIKSRGSYFPESDVWSLGVSFYYAATGNYPFNIDGDTTVEEYYNTIMKNSPKLLNTGNEMLDYIVNRTLDKNPTTRITLAEMEEILEIV